MPRITLSSGVLVLIVSMALVIRLIPYTGELWGLDPFFHLRMTQQIIEVGSLPVVDHLSNYPDGRMVSGRELPLLPYVGAYSYHLFSPLVTLEKYLAIFPAFFGAVSCIPLYLLGRELYGRKVGLFSAALFAVLPASVARSWAGFFDKEALAGFLILSGLAVFLSSIRDRSMGPRILAGILFGLCGLTWGGFEYFLLLLTAFGFGAIWLDEREISRTYIVSAAVAMIMLFLFLPLRYPVSILWRSPVFSITALGLVLSTWNVIKSKRTHYSVLILMIILLSLLIFKMSGTAILDIGQRMAAGNTNIVRPTVAESGAAKLFYRDVGIGGFINGDWFVYFSMLIFFVPLGGWLSLRGLWSNRDYRELFVFLFLSSAVLVTWREVRLSFVLAPIVCIVGARVLLALADDYPRISWFLAGFVFLSVFTGGVLNAERVEKMPSQGWIDALTWVEDNTPEDAVILSWWDYGYWIQAISHRTTVVDGGHTDIKKDIEVARALCSNPKDAVEIIKGLNPQARPVYFIVSKEEFEKTGAISTVAGDGLEIGFVPLEKWGYEEIEMKLEDLGYRHYYLDEDKGGYYVLMDREDPGMKEMLLSRLLPFPDIGMGQGLEHFEMVYDNNYVYVYEVV